MGTTLNKLEYLDETKSQIKTALNQFGSGITENDTFRSYVSKINDIYDNWEKVTGEGTDITLNNTKASKLALSPKGNISQETTTGKNLLPYSTSSTEHLGITYTNNNDGSYTLNGTSTGTSYFSFYTSTTSNLIDDTTETYTFSKGISNNNIYMYIYEYVNNTWEVKSYSNNDYITYTPSGNQTGQIFRIIIYNGITLNNVKIYPMLVKGTTIGDFEPYTGGIASPNPSYPSSVKVIDGEYEVTVSNSDNTQSQTQTIDTSPNPLYSEDDLYFKAVNGDSFYDSLTSEQKANLDYGYWYVHNKLNKFSLKNLTWVKDGKNRFNTTAFRNIIKKPASSSVSINAKCNFENVVSADATYMQNNGIAIGTNGDLIIYIDDYADKTVQEFQTIVNNLNGYIIAELQTPTNTKITNTTLINQLEALSNMKAYQDQTNISQTHNVNQTDMIISASTLKKGGN